MITYTTGNLLDAEVDALVNTVNTVGVMGKGIALMFKDRFPNNMQAYAEACQAGKVQTGKVFVTSTDELLGAKWIINFPTKQHWRAKSQMNWIEEGLQDLRQFIIDNNIQSIAIPPLGAGNGGLDWQQVKPKIEKALGDLKINILVYEPTTNYQNVHKSAGTRKLTPARALVLELVRRYLILGMECSHLEVQKLAYMLQRSVLLDKLDNPLKLTYQANRYGPYADNLRHLLDSLDGNYLQANKRIADSQAFDNAIRFNYQHKQTVQDYLEYEAKDYLNSLNTVNRIIDGFESPYGMELLSTVDWLIQQEKYEPNLDDIKRGLADWSAGLKWGKRKLNMFNDKALHTAIDRLAGFSY